MKRKFQMAYGTITLLIFLIHLLKWVPTSEGLIAYDCGSAASNVTTVSLLTIDECDVPVQKVNSTRTKIELLQVNDFTSVMVRQCKVEIDRVVRKCGMFSHTSDVSNGKYSYIQSVAYQDCMRMQSYGTYVVGSVYITHLKVNQTMSRPVTLAGQVESDGTCAGSAYTDSYGSWTDVVVLANVKITLQTYRATVKVNSNNVVLRSGVHCMLKAGHCLDIEGGDTYWETVPEGSCKENSYGILYSGYATKVRDSMDLTSQLVYTIVTQETTFALAVRGETMTCGYTLHKTEHPRLFIVELPSGSSVFKKTSNPLNNDIFTYMNSKFVYVEKHFRTQLNLLYRNIIQQQCNLEQKMLQNALAIATQSPDIFAYHIMKSPGYTSILAGEVVHIVKCVPVEVQVAPSTTCFTQLPVLRDNRTYYMAPQTHILLRQGTQVSCNPMAPVMYQLATAWYRLSPKPVETIPPTILQPMTKPIWTYTSPGDLATSGIYSQADLEEFKDHILFPAERPAVLNTLARGMLGQPATIHGGSVANLFDGETIEKIASSAWKKIWSRIITFGNISAGLFGIYIIARVVKIILDTILHGYALHSVYGCSCYLIGAFWDSLTQLLLLIGGKKITKPNENSTELQELTGHKNLEKPSSPITTAPSCPTAEINYQNPRPTLPQEERPSFSLSLRG